MKTNITIGIPAYNEAANIGYLLSDINRQLSQTSVVRKIIIVNDGSLDSTLDIVNEHSSPKLKIISHKVRRGKAAAVNKISAVCQTPVLVLLDADIRLPDPGFLDELVRPVVSGQADLASTDAREIQPVNFFEKSLRVGNEIKRAVFNTYRDGRNFYTCHGPACALSRPLYKSLRFRYSAGQDLYSYVYCQIHGFKYRFVPGTYYQYRLPANYADHEKQSIRFSQSVAKINAEFGLDNVRQLTVFPWDRIIYTTVIYFFRQPLSVLLNVPVYLLTQFRSLFVNRTQDTWAMVVSSKTLKTRYV